MASARAHLKRFDRTWCLEGTLHWPALMVLGLALSLWFWPVWVLVGWFAYTMRRLEKPVWVVALLVGVLFCLRQATYSVERLDAGTFTARVCRVERGGTRLVVDADGVRAWVYVKQTAARSGDDVRIDGRLSRHDSRGMPRAFDYPAYLEANGIGGVVYDAEVNVLARGASVYRLRETVERRVMRFDEAHAYLSAFLLAEREGIETTGVLGQARFLGVAHVFAISGMHVTLLSGMVGKAVMALSKRTALAEAAAAVVALMYALVASFSPSAMRAAMLVGFIVTMRQFHTRHTTFDALSLAFVVSLFINPLVIRLAAFQLSFLVAASILLVRETMQHKTALQQAWRVSVIAWFATVPIVSTFEAALHPLTVVLNVVVVGVMSAVVLPLAFITFALPAMEPLFLLVIQTFETVIEAVSMVFSWRFRLYFSSPYVVLLYYVIFVMIYATQTHRFRYVVALGVLMIGVHLTPYLDPRSHAIFFHVHGDAALLRDAHNRCTVLIDTGEGDTADALVQSLRGLHVTRLDYVFISHRHTDHYGAYDAVSEAFPIGHTITNVNQALVEGEVFTCGNLMFYLFPTQGVFTSENDRSMVMKAWLENEVLLFTGDIEGPREAAMLDEDLRATLLKVAHHGSITSSSEAFLSRVGADEALISAHRHNRFNHPSPVVVRRLEAHAMRVHRTDQEGTVWFRYFWGSRTKTTVP